MIYWETGKISGKLDIFWKTGNWIDLMFIQQQKKQKNDYTLHVLHIEQKIHI
jgi:hypothetical protein